MSDKGPGLGPDIEPTAVRCGIVIRVLIDTTCDIDDLGRLAQEAGYHIAHNLRVLQRPGDPAKQFTLDTGFSIQCRHNLGQPEHVQDRKELDEIMRRSEVAALERLYRLDSTAVAGNPEDRDEDRITNDDDDSDPGDA